jgi:hypothetical protein
MDAIGARIWATGSQSVHYYTAVTLNNQALGNTEPVLIDFSGRRLSMELGNNNFGRLRPKMADL